MFSIACALNQPFGFDVIDINMNNLCAQLAKQVLDEYVNGTLDVEKCIQPQKNAPAWLESAPPPRTFPFHKRHKGLLAIPGKVLKKVRKSHLRSKITVALAVFTVWCVGIVMLTWALTRDDRRPEGSRWWSLYIPVDADTSAFISLGLFLLLSFWLSDAYSRYWTASSRGSPSSNLAWRTPRSSSPWLTTAGPGIPGTGSASFRSWPACRTWRR